MLRKRALLPVTLALALFGGPANAGTMSTGWYWPNGSGDTCGYGWWLIYNPAFSGYHLAQDICNPLGSPVYAIGDGDVIRSSTTVGGYGPGATKGGAVVVRHQAADGTWFTALYGHLDSPRALGAVAAGQVLGYSNAWSPPHIHFGIHPGYDPASPNPYLGYTSDPDSAHGFTDPFPFLLVHGRSAPASCATPVGQAAPSPQVFIDAYNRNGGQPGIGCAYGPVHAWGAGNIQDFRGGAGGEAAIMQASGSGTAYLVHGDIWLKYKALTQSQGGSDPGIPGYPITDERNDAAPSSVTGATIVYNNFQNGAIEYHVTGSHKGTAVWLGLTILNKWKALGYAASSLGLPILDEFAAGTSPSGTSGRVVAFENGEITKHGNGLRVNQAFETHGALDASYVNSFGGTSGCLGFPIADQGAANSAIFELGMIAWNGSQYQASCGTVRPPTPPNFRVTGTTATSVGLGWNDVAGESGYRVYKWNGDGFVFHTQLGAGLTTYTEVGLNCNGQYFYEVSAYNASGESDHAAWIQADTLACTGSPPTVISNSASSDGLGPATLNGTVNPNGTTTTTAFEYGTTLSYGSTVAAQTLTGSTAQAVAAPISGLACDTTYHFRAKGTNAGGTRYGLDLSFIPACTSGATPVAQYRLYSPVTLEHLYTTDLNEYNVLGTRGWIQENVAYRLLTNGIYNGVATVPLYRLYHAGVLQHHWTTDLNEYTVLGTRGWTQEGVTGYLSPTQVSGTVPLYRMALASPPLHLWTTDLNEYDTLATRGWVKEGGVGFVVP